MSRSPNVNTPRVARPLKSSGALQQPTNPDLGANSSGPPFRNGASMSEPDQFGRWNADVAFLLSEVRKWVAVPGLGSRLDLEDLVQQALIQAYLSRENFRGSGELAWRAYLKTTLKNTLRHAVRFHGQIKRDFFRDRSIDVVPDGSWSSAPGLRNELVAELTTPSQKAVRKEEAERLSAAIATLPGTQRVALELHYRQEKSLEQIGRELGCSTTTVYNLIERGKKRLKEILGDSRG
jgi:RNA polymerase sigma-70 factor, ECF subfamily